MINDDASDSMDEKLPEYKMIDAYDGHLTVRGIKHAIGDRDHARGRFEGPLELKKKRHFLIE